MPLDTLPISTDGVNLTTKFNGGVSYSPSVALYQVACERALRTFSVAPKDMVFVQNPTLDLTGADAEVEEIVKQFPVKATQPTLLKHAMATKANVLDTLHAREISLKGHSSHHPVTGSYGLHCACHGNHNVTERSTSAAHNRWEHALSLAAGTTLNVADILDSLTLRACQFCILSACCTGTQDVESTEAVGLTSAFLVAGVPCVVSSLWPVHDVATALLMHRFYDQFMLRQQGTSITAALRNAQTWLRTLTLQDVKTNLGAGNRLVQDLQQRVLRGFAVGDKSKTGEVSTVLSSHASPSPSSLFPHTSCHQQIVTVNVDYFKTMAGIGGTTSQQEDLSAFCGKKVSVEEMGTAFADVVKIDRPVVYHESDVDSATSSLRNLPTSTTGVGKKFTLTDWNAFVAAPDKTFIYTHLFPTTKEGTTTTMLPERDYWFEYTDPTDAAKKVRVILHVHYLGTWAEADESRIAQINARCRGT
jgi:hypothetical protein